MFGRLFDVVACTFGEMFDTSKPPWPANSRQSKSAMLWPNPSVEAERTTIPSCPTPVIPPHPCLPRPSAPIGSEARNHRRRGDCGVWSGAYSCWCCMEPWQAGQTAFDIAKKRGHRECVAALSNPTAAKSTPTAAKSTSAAKASEPSVEPEKEPLEAKTLQQENLDEAEGRESACDHVVNLPGEVSNPRAGLAQKPQAVEQAQREGPRSLAQGQANHAAASAALQSVMGQVAALRPALMRIGDLAVASWAASDYGQKGNCDAMETLVRYSEATQRLLLHVVATVGHRSSVGPGSIGSIPAKSCEQAALASQRDDARAALLATWGDIDEQLTPAIRDLQEHLNDVESAFRGVPLAVLGLSATLQMYHIINGNCDHLHSVAPDHDTLPAGWQNVVEATAVAVQELERLAEAAATPRDRGSRVALAVSCLLGSMRRLQRFGDRETERLIAQREGLRQVRWMVAQLAEMDADAGTPAKVNEAITTGE